MWRRALPGVACGNWIRFGKLLGGVVPDVGGDDREEVLALNGEGPLRRVYPGG